MILTIVIIFQVVSIIDSVFGYHHLQIPKCKIPLEEFIKIQNISKC